MLGLFAQAADVVAQQPVVSEGVGYGMVIITALTMLKQTATEVIGYFTKKSEHSTELALIKQEHATCKNKTDELEKVCNKQADQIMTLNVEVGVLKNEIKNAAKAQDLVNKDQATTNADKK
jgi:hypothetical protein